MGEYSKLMIPMFRNRLLPLGVSSRVLHGRSKTSGPMHNQGGIEVACKLEIPFKSYRSSISLRFSIMERQSSEIATLQNMQLEGENAEHIQLISHLHPNPKEGILKNSTSTPANGHHTPNA